jgi:hypothetical protein
MLNGIAEELTPQLLVREGVEASKVTLIGVNAVNPQENSFPLLSLEIDKISNFEFIDGNTKTLYTDAGEIEGTTVYGRGHKLLITLINQGTSSLTVRSVKLRLVAKEPNFPPALRYDKLQMTVPHTRLPIEAIESPIYLQESDAVESTKEIGDGRIYLGSKNSPDAAHQITFTTEAKSPGLWTYQLEAEYTDPTTNQRQTVVCQEKLMILLRGR